jgi:hypothetical protein
MVHHSLHDTQYMIPKVIPQYDMSDVRPLRGNVSTRSPRKLSTGSSIILRTLLNQGICRNIPILRYFHSSGRETGGDESIRSSVAGDRILNDPLARNEHESVWIAVRWVEWYFGVQISGALAYISHNTFAVKA